MAGARDEPRRIEDDPPMRLLCPLACLAACTFSSPHGGSDAGGDDVDARDPSWVAIDTLTVPADGTAITSKVTLQAGVTYLLRASGTYYYDIQRLGDAEYFEGTVLGTHFDGESGVDVGLAVNDTLVDMDRTPKWGPYNDTHIYEVEWPGAGTPITAQLHDGQYTINSGALGLLILKPE